MANPIERIKQEKDGLAVRDELAHFAQIGWEAIDKGDLERLKWVGWFFRKKTPGRWMLRLRLPGGFVTSEQMYKLADILKVFSDIQRADITTRQNLELRGVRIEDSVEIMSRLHQMGLTSIQSGMDNVRNVVGSPIAGLDPEELIDVRDLTYRIQDMLTSGGVGNPEFSNLPRKFNISITGDRENSAHAEINDIGFVPALKYTEDGRERIGFNVLVGGLFSPQRAEAALPLDAFVEPDGVVELCRAILIVYRDHGPRDSRGRSRMMYLIDDWGIARFRTEVEQLYGPLEPASEHECIDYEKRDHVGIHRQKQPGVSFVGLHVTLGKLGPEEMIELGRLAEVYGSGEVRLTVEQSVIIPDIADHKLDAFLAEPLLKVFSPDPPKLLRGLVSCTGLQFCNLAIIETKNRALAVVERLEAELEVPRPIRMHWSGCPNSCGQSYIGDIGFIGCKTKVDGKTVDAVDILVGGRIGKDARLAELFMEAVPCEELHGVLKTLLVERFGAVERLVGAMR